MIRHFYFLLCFYITSSMPAVADVGDILIEGKINNRNNGDSYIIKASDFDKIKKNTIKTTTPWTPKDEVVTFEGVKVEDILKIVNSYGKTLRVSALNDYWVDIPISDATTYKIILANKMNGEYFKVRNFGPYFIIYPLDEHSTVLNNPTYLARFIWQVNKITVL